MFENKVKDERLYLAKNKYDYLERGHLEHIDRFLKSGIGYYFFNQNRSGYLELGCVKFSDKLINASLNKYFITLKYMVFFNTHDIW